MTIISHRDMRNNSSEVLRRVAAGESFTITNKGHPVAELIPARSSTLAELESRGQLRRALHGPEALAQVKRVQLEEGTTTADIVDDVRGRW